MFQRVALIAAGALCGSLVALSANAAPMGPTSIAPMSPATGLERVQYRHGPQARHHHVRKPVCHMQRVKVRGHHGRPMFKTVRVCR